MQLVVEQHRRVQELHSNGDSRVLCQMWGTFLHNLLGYSSQSRDRQVQAGEDFEDQPDQKFKDGCI